VSYTITSNKRYNQPPQAVFQAALGAVGGLEGKIEEEDAGSGTVQARFNKTIHGKVLGDRTRFHVAIKADGDESVVEVEGYPIDPVGRKLMFGARKGVTKQVMTWFFAHLEHRLP
jgi:hypothetical protein